MQVFDRSVSILLHIAIFVAPFPLLEKKKTTHKKKRTLCRTDSSEVASRENEMEEKRELR